MTEPTTIETILDVDPEQAAVWLTTVSKAYWLHRFDIQSVGMYDYDMRRGSWKDADRVRNSNPIRISHDGRLADGLARLLAVVSSEKTIRFRVITGGPTHEEYRAEAAG